VVLFDEKERSFDRLASLRGHVSTVLSLLFVPSEDGSLVFISGGTDGQILFWDITTLTTYTRLVSIIFKTRPFP
jgi:WD40 repeat protein